MQLVHKWYHSTEKWILIAPGLRLIESAIITSMEIIICLFVCLFLKESKDNMLQEAV